MNKYKLTYKHLVPIIIIIFIFLFTFLMYQNNYISVTKYEIKTQNDSLSGLKIVHISDLHNESFLDNHNSLVEKIEKQHPDIIFCTGDIIDMNRTNIKIALEFIDKINEIAPIYYVAGNHEYAISAKERTQLYDGLRELGVIILNNEIVSYDYNKEMISIIGVCHYTSDQLEIVNNDCFSILLGHDPSYIDYMLKFTPNIILTGHTHGGQFRLPFIGGIYAPNQGVFPKYDFGKFIFDSSVLIVNRGLGNSLFPQRLFNTPEIVVIELI